VLSETFTVAMGIGFALVILGSTLATRSSRTIPESYPAPLDAGLRPIRE